MGRKSRRLLRSCLAVLVAAVVALGGFPTSALEYALGETEGAVASAQGDEAGQAANGASGSLGDDPADGTTNAGTTDSDSGEAQPAEDGDPQPIPGQEEGAPADSSEDDVQEVDDSVAAEDEPAAEEAATEDEDATSVSDEATAPRVAVLAHVQRQGWAKEWVRDGKAAGSQGKSLRMEALRLRLEDLGAEGGSISYRAHVQSEGWQAWKKDGAVSGSVGKSRRIEALQIKLEGAVAQRYDVWYRVHAQSYGWMAWTKNGESAGTAGKSLRLEAVQVVLVRAGEAAPASDGQAINRAFVGAEEVSLSAHVQKIGWTRAVGNGAVAGTTGRGLRVEALRASLSGARVPGGVQTTVHVQSKGWMKAAGNGAVAGTTGKGLRIEALKMCLTGEAASAYDLYYRVHVQNVGWLAWASEGQVAGSTGMALRVEAVQTRLVPKGAAAPANDAAWPQPALGTLSVDYASVVSGTRQASVANGRTSGTTGRSLPINGFCASLSGTDAALGGITYRAYMQGKGWEDWASNGALAGDGGSGRRLEALQIKLTGRLSSIYNVWYRAHAQGYGWMGWASNGTTAGTMGLSKRVEAIQIRLVPKSMGAPGSTTRPYLDGTLRQGLEAAKSSRSVTTFGGFQASNAVLSRLKNAVNGIRAQGYDVGFIMMDLTSHKGVAYNCDALFYGASSIKAPYIASVVSRYPNSVITYAHDMTETLYYSWDYNYKNVLAAYGKGPMRTWCAESGARASIAESLPWADYSARDLAKLWARNYQLFSQSSAGEQFGRWCERPNVSTIHATLGGKYRTRSKAGWIDDGGSVNPNVNGGGRRYRVSDDGGIVYARNGAYVVAIMSSVPANHNALNGLTAAIDAAHSAM